MSIAPAKTGQVRKLPINSLRPSPENSRLYRPVTTDDPAVRALADSIRRQGILEPLVVTQDGYIISGHRRFVAARLAGLHAVPARIEPMDRDNDIDTFVKLLVEHNCQRTKATDEVIREQIVLADRDETYREMIEHRARKARVKVKSMELGGRRDRSAITKAKQPMLDAIERALEAFKDHLPTSVRHIHYYLLGDPPLKHASKPDSVYENTLQSYKNLDDLLVRARFEGIVDMYAIDDETRPTTIWNAHDSLESYLREELDNFCRYYWRKLTLSQPCHIEIMTEKLTLKSIIDQVAGKYTINATIARGFNNVPTRRDVADRFRKSGKERLIILALTDFDPDGKAIAESFARSIRDEFHIPEVHAVRVALNAEQVRRYNLPTIMKAKETSSRFKEFVDEHGHDVWELEALAPADLQKELTRTIDSILDREAFDAEIEHEKEESRELAVFRQYMLNAASEYMGCQK